MSDGFLRVKEAYREERVLKKSRFLTALIPIESEEDAQKNLELIRKTYADATHNCYAYIADEAGRVVRFGDDGEPQGTAGIPILEVLKKRGVKRTLAVVTRYFGGIKLGASGLVNAYSGSVAQALDHAPIVWMEAAQTIRTVCPYAVFAKVEEAVNAFGGEILRKRFDATAEIVCAVPQTRVDALCIKLTDLTLGKAEIERQSVGYYPFAIKSNSGE